MKTKLSLTLLLSFIFYLLSSQVPQGFNYQVVVRDGSTNDPLTNQSVSFRMSILKGNSSGESQYSELHSANTGALGIVNLVIGNGTGKTGDITTIDWGADTYYLKIEIDKTGGSGYIEMGTIQLLSVPYAMYARTSSDAVKLTGDQTISGTKSFTGITMVSTPVNASDATTKAYVDAVRNIILITGDPAEFLALGVSFIDLFNAGVGVGILLQNGITEQELTNAGLLGTVLDIDGNTYKWIRIGTQTWMAENLKTTRYNNGEIIGTTEPATLDISGETTPAYQWAYDGNESNAATYGRLYTWFAVTDSRGLCPTGWNIPNDTYWKALTDYLFGLDIAGGKLKETGITHWETPNADATNGTGFTALPGGYRSENGVFASIGILGNYWTFTQQSTTSGRYRSMLYLDGKVHENSSPKSRGKSVRCVKY